MSLYPTKSYPINKGPSEFEILKASHRFLREDNDTPNDTLAPATTTTTTETDKAWEDKLAEKYYESLYREFALCDLKHYKSGSFALRWRTEDEVVAGTGESTCGNTRCQYHHVQQQQRPERDPSLNRKKQQERDRGKKQQERDRGKKKNKGEPSELTTLELPFAYVERGEAKSALVKVVLCPKCVKKLMWKRRKDRERAMAGEGGVGTSGDGEGKENDELSGSKSEDGEDENEMVKGKEKEAALLKAENEGRKLKTPAADRNEERGDRSRRRHSTEPQKADRVPRRRSSRSRSPRHHSRHSHSPSRKHSRRDT